MNRKKIISVCALLLASATHIATSKSPPPIGFEEDIQEQNLQGLINGVDWVFGSGVAILDSEDNEFLVRLYAEAAADPCSLQTEVNKILLTMPNQIGPYELSLGTNTVTLVEERDDDAPMNYISVQGVVELYELGDDSLSAGMAVMANDNSWVNGQFDITICE